MIPHPDGRRGRTLGRDLRAALAAVAVLTALPASGQAAVQCGMLVEEQLVLDRDLRCDGPGLIVRNPRTVLQMNGHTITSTRPCGGEAPPIGIVVEATAEGAQILGPGVVRAFATGIAVLGAARTQVRDVRVADSCAEGILVVGADDVRLRDLVLHRNGLGAGGGRAAIDVADAARFLLEGSTVALNGAPVAGGAVDLRGCLDCRIAGNRVIGNRGGAGIHLDGESRGTDVERNIVLDHRPADVVDEGPENVIALDVFERGSGVAPPPLEPLAGTPAPAPPAVAGCGIVTTGIAPRTTATLACPQDPGLRGLRNSVVGYRTLNVFSGAPYGVCDPVAIVPTGTSPGGALRCTNSDPLWHVLLELTCCLN